MMPRCFFLVLILLLSGCSGKHAVMVNLNARIPDQKMIYSVVTADLQGVDKRSQAEVIRYEIGSKPVTRIQNLTEPAKFIENALADALVKQGVVIEEQSLMHISVTINEMLVKVTRKNIVYNAEAITNISVLVSTADKSIEKKYDRKTKEDYMSRPKAEKLEQLLDDQISDIITRVIQDQDIRAVLSVR